MSYYLHAKSIRILFHVPQNSENTYQTSGKIGNHQETPK